MGSLFIAVFVIVTGFGALNGSSAVDAFLCKANVLAEIAEGCRFLSGLLDN